MLFLKILNSNVVHFKIDLGLWTGDYGNGVAVMEIGKKLKERLSMPQKMMIGYQRHEDTIEKTGSTSKYIFTV